MTPTLHLVARIADRAVAFDSRAVESVVDLDTIVPVPRVAPGIAGVAALRSRVVTVVDPRVALGAGPARQPTRRAIVIKLDGHAYAILVDSLQDVAPYVRLATPPGLALDGGWSAAARGMIDLDGSPVLVLDPAALVPHAA